VSPAPGARSLSDVRADVAGAVVAGYPIVTAAGRSKDVRTWRPLHAGALLAHEEVQMNDIDLPNPEDGFVVTHFLVVADQDRSRTFCESVFAATVAHPRDPVILKIANSWLILNEGGGPTDDKPAVTLAPPADPSHASAFLNIRVADIAQAYAQWSARGA